MSAAAPFPTVMVVPTGIGCEVGGYAGDALPAARLLAAASGGLITHPNVLNAAALYWPDPRLLYVEGWALDRFCAAELALRPRRSRRVGLLIDAGLEPELQRRHRQVADAVRVSLGLPIGPVLVSDAPFGVSLRLGSSGTSWGGLENPSSLLRGGEALVASGAEAIAVVARFPDEPDSEALAAYRRGDGVDGLAGAEAVISHLLVCELGLPCAHAPALAPLPVMADLDPRAAAEEIGHTFLSCVLVGLSQAPDLVAPGDVGPGDLTSDRIGAVVAPAGALGGAAVLACAERGIPVIAVQNPCALTVDAAALGLTVIPAQSYVEAAGWLTLLREGLDAGRWLGGG
ncbi:DUF3326 domain-containing protein [Synechococcus sp. RSCCF101]|uniref:DUF3326 domain-containing protein n=1 Tax=Synechococcus sp. RSCCF101 TaxID=2511069 RepID=UPI0012466BEF|nr:DUF3326 domain-containing protein [Synechococcus sp. RSCCF101]QEY33131.1 DUF3326 domain-containing protein [Synechococcus sp. RSCCF101]